MPISNEKVKLIFCFSEPSYKCQLIKCSLKRDKRYFLKEKNVFVVVVVKAIDVKRLKTCLPEKESFFETKIVSKGFHYSVGMIGCYFVIFGILVLDLIKD